MIVLTRKGQEVFYKDQKLTIVKQESKGPDKEVVKIKGLEGSNGQKWISLTRLVEGDNTIETQGREVVISKKNSYVLTEDEKSKVKKLQDQIDSIISEAKKRYVPKPDVSVDPTKMTEEERQTKIKELVAYYKLDLTKLK